MRVDAAELPVALDRDLRLAGLGDSESLYPGITPACAAAYFLRQSLLKKFTNDKPSKDADTKALDKFLTVNEQCRGLFPKLDLLTEAEAVAIGEAKSFIYDFFFPKYQDTGILGWLKIAQQSDVGNGANIGSYSTDFFSKFGTSKLSTTDPFLYRVYREAISGHPLWSDVENIRHEFRGIDIVRGSRLSFVPKTTEISRTICTEPLLNMMFQKGIGYILERRLAETLAIRLDKQPDKNRNLALIGAATGNFGTIDLASASDSISISLLRHILPSEVLTYLTRTRCPVTVLPDGREIELHMISSMGNAFTFPLQTMIFSAIVYGCYRSIGIPLERPFGNELGNFAVFGDDIIVRREAYSLVLSILSRFGFTVNVDKSFNEGLFRESCGEDFWSIHNVRGVYIKRLLTDSDRYSAINRLNRWSARWGVPLRNLIGVLRKSLRFLPIPFDEADDCGIKIPLAYVERKRFDRNTGGVQYRYLSFEPPKYDMRDVLQRPPKLRGYFHNHSAIVLAAVAGTLRKGHIVVRPNGRISPSLRRRYSSSWDYIPPSYGFCRGNSHLWKEMTVTNLNLC